MQHGSGSFPQAADARRESGAHHILASATAVDDHVRVLKHGDTFGVFDHYGDIKPGGLGEKGLYHEGTRYLSCLLLELEGNRPFFLGANVRDENDLLAVALTNPDMLQEDWLRLPLGTLELSITRLIWRGALYQQIRIQNHGLERVETTLFLHFAADYADIFEIRGMKRFARGQDLAPEVDGGSVTLRYLGLDRVLRSTSLRFTPEPSRLTASNARIDVVLAPKQEAVYSLSAACQREPERRVVVAFEEARNEVQVELNRDQAWTSHLRTPNASIKTWIHRADSDLHMMTTELPTGPYPYAGVPWFNTPFGRDGIITALECLWLRPQLARGVLAYLASSQATEVVADEDAEPGKIVHEIRQGEMAALKEMPFGRYYGSVDGTPLFVMLAGAYYERTGDQEFIRRLWPHIEAALAWIDRYGDRDGDGFVEYDRQSAAGLIHQGWKDSDDAIFHADGSLASPPVALCEVQGYVYAAQRAAAELAAALGLPHMASGLMEQAEALRQRFEQAFWCDELSTYALALDGAKRPCRVLTSNAGHCLFAGIAGRDHAQRIGRTLLKPALFSGWGIRTVADTEARYNPMGYHVGCIWPHDNALIAHGLARYGMQEKATAILSGLFRAGLHFDLQRMPELFCGFRQVPEDGPVPYPVACAPQAWSAASVFLLLQACLGLEVSALKRQICFTRPQLPAALNELSIHNLEIAGAVVDLLLVRRQDDVGLTVLRREGDVQILVAK